MLCFETSIRNLYERLNASLDALYGPLFMHTLLGSVHDKFANLLVPETKIASILGNSWNFNPSVSLKW
jgi:hypothetical protein